VGVRSVVVVEVRTYMLTYWTAPTQQVVCSVRT
jgi:hypothetical protein